MIKKSILPVTIDSSIQLAFYSVVDQSNEYININKGGRKAFSFSTTGSTNIILDNTVDYRKRIIRTYAGIIQPATIGDFIIGGAQENAIRFNPSYDGLFYSGSGNSTGFVTYYGIIDANTTNNIAIWANDINGALTVFQRPASGNNHDITMIVEFSEVLSS